MTNKMLLLGVAASVLAVSACTAHQSSLPPGEYESKKESVDADGTKRMTTTKTEVVRQQDGSKKAVVEKESSTDPKGLFNKSTSESKTVTTNH
ncbi:MAG: hypothetical protein ACT4OY_07290 [Alphaproteobacteria bacterium]